MTSDRADPLLDAARTVEAILLARNETVKRLANTLAEFVPSEFVAGVVGCIELRTAGNLTISTVIGESAIGDSEYAGQYCGGQDEDRC